MLNINKLEKPFEEIKGTESIIFFCDYCGKESQRTKKSYLNGHKNIKKDCCCLISCVNQKIKEANLEKHGVEHTSKLPEVQGKRNRTSLERYGCEIPLASVKIKEKIKQTNLERYGVENVMQSASVREKLKEAMVKKYGVEHQMYLLKTKEKIKETNLERYGVEHTFQVEEFKEKAKLTIVKKYGVDHASKLPETQEKKKQTNLDKFGVEHPLQSPEIREKAIQTNIERYGSAYPTHKFGKTQKEIQDWLNSFGFNFKSDHTVLGSKELDLYDSNLNFAIEYCGLHWHHENSPQPRPSNYHISKFNICKEKGIQLITIFEDEWLNNQEVIKSVILSKLGVFEKRLYARKCIAKEINKKEFTDFCDKHHVQGGNYLAKVCFGLYYENELIGVMDLGVHHRKQTKGEMVLTRLCFKAGYQIVGGASKLFSHCVNWCKNNGIKKIISWSDNRWSNGSIYKNLNFVLEEELGSDYAYVNIDNPKERISKQSQMKCNTGCPKDKSEKEWALENGLSRIWDCGKVRWVFIIN